MARYYQGSKFFIHRCSIERPVFAVVDGTIRDTQITQWQVVAINVPCWFESQGDSYVGDAMMGRVPVQKFLAWFAGNVDVQMNDRLVKGSDHYLVEGENNYHDEGEHISVHIRKQNYAQS